MEKETLSTTSEHGVLPLVPMDRPRSLFVQLLFRATRFRYGKTPTAFRVLYARFPLAGLILVLMVVVLDRFLMIGKEWRLLLQVATATQNGCTFCFDLLLAEAVRHKVGRERFADLATSETSAVFSQREKAAIAYAAAVAQSLQVPDAVFKSLKEHFSEREITEIVWVCAVERYFNSLALPLRIGSDRLAS
jgi:AhpD family alkylhydroperoxidase